MIRSITGGLLMALALALSSASAGAPATGELTELLRDFLDGASRNDPAAHERFWDDELVYTSSGGERFGKDAILSSLVEAPSPPPPSSRYRAEEVDVRQYGDVAVVAFRLIADTPGSSGAADTTAQYFNTGTFVRRDGEWRAVAWQATRIPD